MILGRDKMLRPFFRGSWTRALACGEDAGRWLFEDSPFEVLHNGFALEKYAFDAVQRNEVRSRLGFGTNLPSVSSATSTT